MTEESQKTYGDPFMAIMDGNFEYAAKQYRLLLKSDDSLAYRSNLGTALINMGRLNEAEEVFESIPMGDPNTMGRVIGLGIVYWAHKQHQKAIDTWRLGLDALYQDYARVTLPATLYFSGIRLGDQKVQAEATKLLRRRWKPKHAGAWGMPIAGYLLEKLSTKDLMEYATQQPTLAERHLCQANFWAAVIAMKHGDMESTHAYLVKAGAKKGLALLESECYLARAELGEWAA